jgi:threonine synthase
MRFVSTRGGSPAVGFLQAVEAGLAPDGGLYIPETFPDIGPLLSSWQGLGYAEVAARFLGLFGTDFSEEEWLGLTREAYSRFESPEVAPLVAIPGRDGLYALELFHGPTLAFKDFALQLLGLLYKGIVRRTGKSMQILGATSGDTGSAAIHGCMGQEGLRIVILYPHGRVAPLQERQMACTGASNVVAVPIPGTFDDAQRIVKDLFGDVAFAQERGLAAVNSINISRVLAQCVYYIWAWLKVPASRREAGVHFIVPTGNFGNVLAGWLASRMGLPRCTFQVATNRNDILHRFFFKGDYSMAAVEPSLAPSMDIQLASNFERFLHYALGEKPEQTRQAMAQIRAEGRFTAPSPLIRTHFSSSKATDAQIRATIGRLFHRTGYLACPHTACGFVEADALGSGATVVLATAHPAKFPEAVHEAAGTLPTHPSLERLKSMPLHTTPCDADAESVKRLL